MSFEGCKHTDESKAKISAAAKNRSDVTRARISVAAKNRPPISDETRTRMSVARRGKYCGEKHPQWQGGISAGPYCVLFSPEFKERTRDFFGRVCVECGKSEEENNGRKLDVHHVNFDKSSCCSDVKPLFVVLCRSCHMKTNFNREYWEQHFTDIINEKYGGKCYYTKEEYNQIAQES